MRANTEHGSLLCAHVDWQGKGWVHVYCTGETQCPHTPMLENAPHSSATKKSNLCPLCSISKWKTQQ